MYRPFYYTPFVWTKIKLRYRFSLVLGTQYWDYLAVNRCKKQKRCWLGTCDWEVLQLRLRQKNIVRPAWKIFDRKMVRTRF